VPNSKDRTNLAGQPSSIVPSTKSVRQPIDIEDWKDEEDEGFEMVQGYGIVQETRSEPGASTGGEQSALLGDDRDTTVKRLVKPDGHASIVSCISNLANTIIGSGGCLIVLLF
jgi:hypothetical protein